MQASIVFHAQNDNLSLDTVIRYSEEKYEEFQLMSET